MEEQECDTQAEIERLKVQPVRVVDAERLKNQLACFSMSDIIAEMGSGAICDKFEEIINSLEAYALAHRI